MSDLDNFRKLGISEITLEALRRKGFEEPSPIQEQTIPRLLAGDKDIIGQAQTGTGKTAAFGIPILEVVERGDGDPGALILSPTRELSIQIAEELNSLKGARPLRIAALYGGQNIEIQLQRLRDGIDIVIGTPGRVIDLIERGKLRLDKLQFTVLDEADEMLNMGFIEDIERILAETPKDKRMLMFSATMPPEIQAIAERFMREYEVIRTIRDNDAPELTEQIYFEVRRENKLEALSRIIDMEEDIYAMVFCRTRNDVDELTEKLQLQGYPVEALHGDIAQAQRTRVINGFKSRKFRILIATDVAARGIDVNDLTHVINYSMPQGSETYVHRIGRTGRAGKTGTAITFVTPAESRQLARIKQETSGNIRREKLPHGDEVIVAKKQRFGEKLAEMIAHDEHQALLPFAEELLTEFPEPAELLAAMLKLKFKDELQPDSYKDLGKRPERFDNRDDVGHTRLFIGVGKLDQYGAVKLLDLIYRFTRIKSYRIGKIECYDKFSFVEVRNDDVENLIESFRRQRGPSVEIARDPNAPKEENTGESAARTREFKERQSPDRPVREFTPYRGKKDGDFKPYKGKKEGDYKPRDKKDGDYKPYKGKKDGDRPAYNKPFKGKKDDAPAYAPRAAKPLRKLRDMIDPSIPVDKPKKKKKDE